MGLFDNIETENEFLPTLADSQVDFGEINHAYKNAHSVGIM